MKSDYIKALLFSFIAVFAMSSCETEVDISAPYKRIPVVFGLLDLQEDTQFVMINRTFLGNGSALEFVEVEDSMLFDNVDARIYYGSGQNDFVQLDSIRINNKDLGGLFYAPSQRVYYALTSDFPSNVWDSDTNFQLRITADGNDISASAKLVDVWDNHPQGLLPSINQDVVTFASSQGYVSNFRFEWRTFQNAVKHQAFIEFNYTEQRTDGSEVPKVIRVPYANSDAISTDQTFNSFGKSGDFFYRYLGNNIDQDANVERRVFGSLNFVIYAAGTDYTTFLNVGDPVSSVGQERPRYSNIDGGEGIGVFSSRGRSNYVKRMAPVGQTTPTITELVEGEYTVDLCFCDPTVGSTFDCATRCQ